MTGKISALANLIDILEDVPGYPFGPDVKAARRDLERSAIPSEDLAALHLRKLIDGARDAPGFLFGADLDEAERALEEKPSACAFR